MLFSYCFEFAINLIKIIYHFVQLNHHCLFLFAKDPFDLIVIEFSI
jgi:hypothetical protein